MAKAKEGKVVKSESKASRPEAPVVNGLKVSGNALDTLLAMKSGKSMTHDAIANVTGRPKGNKLRELTAAGLVKTEKEEETRGFVYTITAKGRDAMTKAGKVK